ncbi:TetR/AcrR family transcriptional regulator [Antrihabitans sp. YC2-6]|uniref:TetR/AcrR family transcriptional regulator n=1 Tax=Antrihabitans sp. YC2-6 TaxID=2799498 RepID=UPI0018F3A089|nr:TetR/AcrR family transcriptional regulator [Antrihabitans sp. YC2-6]MBJ8348866.1 TetR/AcrR family transcriptional regulator [Antrihabitans sp. YC2-6]
MTERPYAGKFADERRAERRERLVAAGFELMGTDGTAGTSVRAVCQKAGLTSRYFYESFAGLDELLLAVFDHIMTRTTDRILAAISATDGSLAATIEACARAFVEVTLDDPHAMRIGFVEAWNSEALMRRRVQTLHSCAHLMASMIAAQNELDAPRLAAVEVAAFMVVGGLLESILGWIDGSLEIEREALVKHFTAAAVGAIERAIS